MLCLLLAASAACCCVSALGDDDLLMPDDEVFDPAQRVRDNQKALRNDLLKEAQKEVGGGDLAEDGKKDEAGSLDEAGLLSDSQSFSAGFLASLAMIVASELGDKTFFIAAIMSMKHNHILVYSAAMAALALMTVLSALMGAVMPLFLPASYTHFAATILFFVFGARLLWDARAMESGPSEELAEVEEELEKSDGPLLPTTVGNTANHSASDKSVLAKLIKSFVSPVFVQTFTMTFLAEWGDRSQVATIALAAARSVSGVTVGGILGHGICTGIAVIGGRLLATKISERTVTIVGGVLFLLFGVHAAMTGP